MRRILSLILCCVAALSAAAGTAKPNILILLADDLGYADVSYNGAQNIRTPNIDKLAASGVKLTDFRACPMCSPTRAGLLTGRWPIRFGLMRSVIPPWSTNGLPASETTLPELLAKAGYEQRGIMGKWHLGHANKQMLPLAHGFTSFYGHYNGAIDYFDHTRENEIDWHRNQKTVKEEGYSTDLLGAEAIRFIHNAPEGKPWFLYLPFNAPHAPYQAKKEDLSKYPQLKMQDRRAYAAMVDCLDQTVGKVLEAVESRKDAANTLVLFFSDNGGILKVGSNAPWRGGKLTVYEGGTRVCGAIRWPAAGLVGGKTFGDRIGYIDVLPTLVAAAGMTPPSDLALDGKNFLPALQGQGRVEERKWFSYIDQSGEAQASVHDGDWKLVAHGDFFTANPKTPPVFELYNLKSDPNEQHDVAGDNRKIVEDLAKALRDFGALRPSPGVPYDFGKEGYKAPKDWVVD